MTEVLLTSETFVKSVTSISENMAGRFLRPSMLEAQEQGLRGIVGDAMMSKLKALVSDGSIADDGSRMYKELLDRAQYYLAYSSVAECAMKASYKTGNFGVGKSSDENLQLATQDEIAKQRYYYQAKADGCCLRLQRWLLDNRGSFPELDEGCCGRMESNLMSAATCGIWLGGPRGRRLP